MIHQHFEQNGARVASVLVLREANRSKGFGFVTFMDVEGVKIAITKKHTIQGRVISCKIATPKLPSSTSTKMFVGGLPLQVTETDLEQYFQQWRAVDRCSVIVNPQTGRSRGFGFVTFYDEESINYVLKFNHFIAGKHVEVKLAKPSPNEANKQAAAAAAEAGNQESKAGEQANNLTATTTTTSTPTITTTTSSTATTSSNATPSPTASLSNSGSSHSPKSKRFNTREKATTEETIGNAGNNWTSAANFSSYSAYTNSGGNNPNNYMYPNQELYENLLKSDPGSTPSSPRLTSVKEKESDKKAHRKDSKKKDKSLKHEEKRKEQIDNYNEALMARKDSKKRILFNPFAHSNESHFSSNTSSYFSNPLTAQAYNPQPVPWSSASYSLGTPYYSYESDQVNQLQQQLSRLSPSDPYGYNRNYINPLNPRNDADSFVYVNPLNPQLNRGSGSRPHSKSTPDSHKIESSKQDHTEEVSPWAVTPQDPIDLIVSAMSPIGSSRRLVKSDVPFLTQPKVLPTTRPHSTPIFSTSTDFGVSDFDTPPQSVSKVIGRRSQDRK